MNFGADPTLAAFVGGLVAIVGVLGAAIWRFRLMFRSDVRADRAAERADAANDRAHISLIKDNERLRAAVDDLDKRLTEQGTKRYEAEAEAAVCRNRMDTAEAAAERANRHAAACEEAYNVERARVVALEMDVRRLESGGALTNGGGDLP